MKKLLSLSLFKKPVLRSGSVGVAEAAERTGSKSLRSSAFRKTSLMAVGLLLAGWAGIANAQTVTIGSTAVPVVSPATSSYFYGPIYRSASTSTFDWSKYAHLYTATELGIPTGAIITNLEWLKSDAGELTGNNTFTVLLGNTTATALTTGTTWGTLTTNATQVYSSSSQNFTGAAGTYFGVPTNGTTNFIYTGGNLLVLTDHVKSGTATAAVNFVTNPAPGQALGNASGTALTATSTLSTASYGDRRPTLRITYIPGSPCVAPPTPGTATASAANACTGINFMLNLTGNSFGAGQTYQWQSSPNGTTGWTNVGPSANGPMFTTSQTATTFYRAVVTCGTSSVNSTTVQVTTPALIPANTFTINKNNPTGGTNFASFAAAINHISCGISGPIVFNVVAGSGPYSEQVTIPAIPGVSATNTVTFNGNANILVSSATTGDAFKLDGADYIRVNNLTIRTEPTATAGAVVSLMNGAENNIFNNNTITHTGSLGSTVTSYGFYVYTGSNNNTFSNNTINGGYYGVYLYNATGTAATALNNNQFTGNMIKDSYFYGIYNYYTNNTLLEGNDISRPTRTNAGSLYAIYLSTGNTNMTISKNRIHNTHDAATSLTGTVYGIYTSSAATVGAENIIKNNALYNFNNNAGAVYGFYNTGGNGTYYFHNTISLDNTAFTGSTLRGMYFLSASTNVKFQNNIVSIKAPTGSRHAIYLGSATITLISNNNDLFAPGGNVGYYTADRATLADWKAANGSIYDQASVSADPIFVNPATGNLQPSSGAVNNIGAPTTPAVTDDITGAPRPATPDPGAYEFVPAANDVGISAILTPNSGGGLTATEVVSVTINNYGTAAQSNIPVCYTLNNGTPVCATFAGPLAPGASATYTFTVPANLAAAGTYTLIAYTNLTGDAIAVNNSATKVVNSIPIISAFPYFQNFESGNGGWVASGSNSSWALGTPAKSVINSAGSGTNSWVTGLTGFYNASENSQVLGPVFNFSSVSAPIIEMKIWWNSEAGWDGAVLQSSINGGTTWQNVGAYQDPFNWYNDNSLDGRAGGQDIGWAGRVSTTNGSNGWVTAKHALTGLGGQSSVMLRIAFGSDPSVQDDGFAFDDVSIYQTPATDVELVAITAPIGSGCGFTATETVTITIKNNGTTATAVPFPVKYQIGATGTPVQENVTTAIAPGATATFSFNTKANFSAVGTYNLIATTMLAGDALPTNDSKTKTIQVVPTISTLPYTEGFENGNGGWIAGGTNSSWAIGTPAKAVINSAGSGTNSYVTGLTGTYNASENSQVTSPCFNFTGLGDPDFEMKVWWNSEGGWDGAVLQSSIDGGTTWQNVGALNAPNNWYNDASLDGRAGGQDIGWAGTGTASSGGWVRAKHKLTGLGGQSSVILRIAFGSDASVHYDGFAFDDIRIGDNTNNLSVNSFVPLTQLCGFGTNEKVEVVLENLGSVAVTGYTVSYTVNGGAAVTAPGPALAPGVPTNFVFPTGANLSAAGTYTIVVTVNKPGDPEAANNSVTYTISNATFTSLPPVFNFETPTTGIAALRTVTNAKSAITEGAAASLPLNGQPTTSTKGMIMEATSTTGWVVPVGITDPWTNNAEFFSAVYICFNPAGGNPNDPLWLSFDLKQVFKTANANTNFRVTVNGTPVGGNQVSPANTYRPPFNGTGGTTDWTKVNIDLTAYKGGNIQIGLESSVAEPFAAGAGTANLVDNIRILRSNPTGVKDNVLARSLSVYPNPSAGLFTVSLPQGKAFEMEVTDLTGKTIMKQTVKGNATQLDLKTQAQGVYMLKITSEGASAIQKLIIQ